MKRSGLIATKLGASSYYDQSGSSTQVTILKVENCTVSAIKTNDKCDFSEFRAKFDDLILSLIHI